MRVHKLSTVARRPPTMLLMASLFLPSASIGLVLLGTMAGAASAGDFPPIFFPPPYVPAPVEPAPRNAGYNPTTWRQWHTDYLTPPPPESAPTEAKPPVSEELPPQQKSVMPGGKTTPKSEGDHAPTPPGMGPKPKPKETTPPLGPEGTPPLPGPRGSAPGAANPPATAPPMGATPMETPRRGTSPMGAAPMGATPMATTPMGPSPMGTEPKGGGSAKESGPALLPSPMMEKSVMQPETAPPGKPAQQPNAIAPPAGPKLPAVSPPGTDSDNAPKPPAGQASPPDKLNEAPPRQGQQPSESPERKTDQDKSTTGSSSMLPATPMRGQWVAARTAHRKSAEEAFKVNRQPAPVEPAALQPPGEVRPLSTYVPPVWGSPKPGQFHEFAPSGVVPASWTEDNSRHSDAMLANPLRSN